MLYGYTCLNMKSFYSILASFIFWPEDTSPNFTKEGGLISADNFVNFHLMHPVHQTNNDWRKSYGYRKENKLGEDRVGSAARDDAFCFLCLWVHQQHLITGASVLQLSIQLVKH